MNRRPVGVILSAIVLGFAALIALVFTATTALSAFLIKHTAGLTVSAPGATPPPNGFMVIVIAITGLFYLAIAIWAIVTLIGLIRMKPWARISVLIIGGCLTLLGAISTIGAFAAQTLLKNTPPTPEANPDMMHAVFLGMAVICLLVAAIGIWWLIYFNLRSTKNAFITSPVAPQITEALYPIDFTYAQQPILVSDEIASTTTAVFQAPTAVRPSPVSMKIVGWLMIVGAIFCFLEAFLPFPLYFLGVTFTGWGSHILLGICAAISAYGGYGLLRLNRTAWLWTIAWYFVGAINVTLMLWPPYRAKMLQVSLAFSQSINARINLPPTTAATAFNMPLMNAFFVVIAIFSDLFFAFVFILLWRARWTFAPKRPDAI